MSYQLELRTLSTAMKDPQATQVIEVNPQWFKTRPFRAIYHAVSDKPTGDVADWFRIAVKKYGYRGIVDNMYKYQQSAVIGDANYLKMYARDLKRAYLQRKISSLATKYSHVAAPETLKAINDYSVKMQDIDIDKDADHTKSAVKGFLHDTKHSIPVGINNYDYKQLNFVLAGGWTPGLFTIAAPTGTGKSSFLINLAYQISKNPNVRIDIISLEMTAREELMRLISRDTGVSNYRLRDPHDRIKNPTMLKAVQHSAKEVADSNIHIYDTARTLTDVTSLIKANASGRKRNTYICFVDYIGLIQVANNGNLKRNQEIGEITRTFKELSSQLHFPLVEISQLNRALYGRDDKMPQINDLAESSSIEKDSNMVILLNQPKKDKPIINVHIAKNREGPKAMIKCYFLKDQMNFEEVPNKYEREHQANKKGKSVVRNPDNV